MLLLSHEFSNLNFHLYPFRALRHYELLSHPNFQSTLFSLFLDSAWAIVCATIVGAWLGVYIIPDEMKNKDAQKETVAVDDTVTPENSPSSEKGGEL